MRKNRSSMADDAPRIVLDTNILVANFQPSNAFRLLLEGARSGQITLVVPALVLQEATRVYEREVEKRLHDYGRAQSALRRLGVEAGSDDSRNPLALSLRYQTDLRYELDSADAEIPALPDVAHEDVVNRVLARRKPFKASGVGYRDTLIWHTVLDDARTHGPVVLCTMNTSDFGEEHATGVRLASELAAEVEAAGLPAASITLVTSLADFVTQHVDTGVVAVHELEEALWDVESELREVLESELMDFDFGGTVDVRPESLDLETSVADHATVTDAHVLTVESLDWLQVVEARRLTDDEVLGTFAADVVATADFEVEIVTGLQRSFETVTAKRTFSVALEATYSRPDEEVTEVRLVSVRVI